MRLVELTIPRQAEFVSLARLVVSSIAGERYSLDDDQLDSLKLAVSEACVMAIDDHRGLTPLRIDCFGEADRLEVLVEGVAADGDASSAVAPTLPFIASLVDDAVIEPTENGRSRVRMKLFCQRAQQL